MGSGSRAAARIAAAAGAALAVLLGLAPAAHAQPPMAPAPPTASAAPGAAPTGTEPAATEATRHPWLASAPLPTPPEARFTNLEDGQRIETPFVARFGLSGFGLAPAGEALPQTGHHHLLIDRELPADFTRPLQAGERLLDFEAGQMEGVLDLAPGTHTLRLLLGNERHVPYLVYSRPLKLTVTRRRTGPGPEHSAEPGVALLAPAPGERVKAPLLAVFHAAAFNVGHQAVKTRGLGHFRLLAERAGGSARPVEPIVFGDGATEAWLAPPPGRWRLRLELVDNVDGSVIAASAPLEFVVDPP